jgi:hypothetical protein
MNDSLLLFLCIIIFYIIFNAIYHVLTMESDYVENTNKKLRNNDINKNHSLFN